MDYVIEPEKRIPVIYDTDVVVAGGGAAGIMAALASAGRGAETVLVDRFGMVGGNIGPGMISGGSLAYPLHLPRRWAAGGIPRDLIERHSELGGGSVPPYTKSHYARDSNIVAYTAQKMLEENGVESLLSTYIDGPILEGSSVKGIYVQNKSGRQAIKARIVIDATGEADIARRAGVPILYPDGMDGGLFFILADVDWNQYEKFKENNDDIADEDLTWAKDTLKEKYGKIPMALIPYVRKAWESGRYRIFKEIEDIGRINCGELGAQGGKVWPFGENRHMVGAQVGIRLYGDFEKLGYLISRMEKEAREYIFETARFWKQYIPGFKDSYLMSVAPFLGARGGPCIDGEYTLTMEDLEEGRRFPDVLYVYKYKPESELKWTDVPYRVLLPKKVDNLLAVGRSASCRPPYLLRARIAAMHMGQAGGLAAALCIDKDTTPRNLDVGELQKGLIDAGFYLGDRSRLEELGLT